MTLLKVGKEMALGKRGTFPELLSHKAWSWCQNGKKVTH